MKLRPFFSFYGGKYRAAPTYPAPEHPTIIEPFAGSAGYSVRHHERQIILHDIDPIICGIWSYLIRVSPAEILSIPAKLDHVNEIKGPQEARWLVGFWISNGVQRPRNLPSAWMRSGINPHSFWGEVVRERIASQVDSIRHWKIEQKDYLTIHNREATWFIDPPYSGKAGRAYTFNRIDHDRLSCWCRSRRGQVIVCENTGADWLPFRRHAVVLASGGSHRKGKRWSDEAIWTDSSCDVLQDGDVSHPPSSLVSVGSDLP